MSRRTVSAALVGLLLAVAAFAPIAAADDPPVTVPTPTIPTPQPDPAPPKAQPKPQPAPAPAPRPAPPRHNPTPVTPTRSYTPPATPSFRPSRPTATATPRKHAKKRHAVHKPKRTRPVVKATPKPKPPAVVVHPQQRSARGPAAATPRDRDWLRWLLLLVAATGLMAVSFVSLVGAARNPARAGAARRRRPSGEPIREVVAERIERPRAVAAAAVALPVPPRPAPPPPPARERVADVEPEPLPALPVEAQAEEADTEVMPEPTEEVCEILVWRGYAKARFYARLDLDETDEFAVAESPSFRFHGNGTPDDTEAARTAHRALVEKLVAKGWEPDGSSGPWYAARFRRPLDRNPA